MIQRCWLKHGRFLQVKNGDLSHKLEKSLTLIRYDHSLFTLIALATEALWSFSWETLLPFDSRAASDSCPLEELFPTDPLHSQPKASVTNSLRWLSPGHVKWTHLLDMRAEVSIAVYYPHCCTIEEPGQHRLCLQGRQGFDWIQIQLKYKPMPLALPLCWWLPSKQ